MLAGEEHAFQIVGHLAVPRLFRELDRPAGRRAADVIHQHVDAAERGEAGVDHSFDRSEEHTSELQSRPHLVCRLLLEKKNKYICRKKVRVARVYREEIIRTGYNWPG